jgi:hypothetical protein
MLARAEGLHRQFFQPGFAGTQAATWEPPVDIFETERELWIIAALPGVEPHDLAISIEGRCSASRAAHLPAPARGAAIHRLEIPHGALRAQHPPAARALSSSIDRSSSAVASSSPEQANLTSSGMTMSDPIANNKASKSESGIRRSAGCRHHPAVRQTVLFPGLMLPLAIGRSPLHRGRAGGRAQRAQLGVLLQTDPAVEDPKPSSLQQVGTAAQMLRYVTAPDGTTM